jgi:hypothetical protein
MCWSAFRRQLKMLPRSKIELSCIHHSIIIRNDSLEGKFPGGLEAFSQTYSPSYNDHIAAYCVTNYFILDAIRELELVGLDHGKDFITIDIAACEMWRTIHSDKIDHPFWFETGVDWLRFKQGKGKVLVWYDG